MIALALALALSTSQPHRSGSVLREFQRLHPCPANGRTYGPCFGYTRDHITPLCAGGKDSPENVQWQTKEEARRKDVLERRQCAALRKARRG